jgi:hypothetical protein
MFAKHTSDKGLLSRIYKEPPQLISQKTKNTITWVRFEQKLYPQKGCMNGN